MQINLSIIQLEGYNYFSYLKTKYKKFKPLIFKLILLPFFVLGMIVFHKESIYIYGAYLTTEIIFAIYLYKDNNIKRYLCTKKIFRYYVILFAIMFLSITLYLLSYNNGYVKVSLYFMTLICYFATIITLIINSIFDKFLMRIYIRKAKSKIKKNNVKIIAITGSYGKTSVKNILYGMLLKKYNVVMTPKSFNTPAGVCKFVNETDFSNVEYFIVEMGAKKKGEINALCKIFKPDYGILTSIGEQHLDTFKSIENIIKTKCELQSNVDNGVMVFNDYNQYVKNADDLFLGKKKSVGTNLDVWYENYCFNNGNPTFDLIIKDLENKKSFSVSTRLLGEHNAVNICLSVAMAKILYVENCLLLEAINEQVPVESRLQVNKLDNNVIIINNGYNSNPYSASCSLRVLGEYNCKKIIITPGFVEMGKKQYELNYDFGRQIAKVVDAVYIVNKVNRVALSSGLEIEGFKECNMKYFKTFKDIDFAGFKDCVVLIENDLPTNYV